MFSDEGFSGGRDFTVMTSIDAHVLQERESSLLWHVLICSMGCCGRE